MTIGWLCYDKQAIISAQAMLDKEREIKVVNNHSLIFGEIGKHNVVIALKGAIRTIIETYPKVTRFLVLDTRKDISDKYHEVIDISDEIHEGDVVFRYVRWGSSIFRSIGAGFRAKYEVKDPNIQGKLQSLHKGHLEKAFLERNNLSESREPAIHTCFFDLTGDDDFAFLKSQTNVPLFISGICSKDGKQNEYAAMVAALIAKDLFEEF